MLGFVRNLLSYFGMASMLKFDALSDPKVQIEQAISEARKRHQALMRQAATVIGNEKQLEMQLKRKYSEIESIKASATQALLMSDEASAAGDEEKAQQLLVTANSFATQLVTLESGVEDLRTFLVSAENASLQAKEAVKFNAAELDKKLTERTKLLTQLEQARLQETINAAMSDIGKLTSGSGITFDDVRDKIEKRTANALGAAELQSNSTDGQRLEIQRAALDASGTARLAQLRAGLSRPTERLNTEKTVNAPISQTS